MNKPKICIVGPGVVGQATGKVFIVKGFEVGFIGRTASKVARLSEDGLAAYTWNDMMNGNFDYDVTFLTVPTPSVDGEVDLSYMESAAKELGKRLRHTTKYHVVVVKSTVPPGTTEELVLKTLEKYSDKKVGKEIGLCMNPEYLREETAYEDSLNPWLIVIGEYDKKSGEVLESVFSSFDCSIEKCSLREAEMQKYIHNLFNAAKIAFFNEMRDIAHKIGADADKMFKFTATSAEGMWNPKYGIRNKGPFMGSCLPKDTQGFYHWAKKNGFNRRLLKTVIETNDELVEKMGLKDQKPNYTL